MKQKYWILYCNILSECTVSFPLCTEFGDLAKKLSFFFFKEKKTISKFNKKKKIFYPNWFFGTISAEMICFKNSILDLLSKNIQCR